MVSENLPRFLGNRRKALSVSMGFSLAGHLIMETTRSDYPPTLFSVGSPARAGGPTGLRFCQRKIMKTLPAPHVLMRQWLHDPQAITVAAFAISALFLGIAGWLIQRNLRHNEPGLRLPLALPFAIVISASGVFGASRLPSPWG